MRTSLFKTGLGDGFTRFRGIRNVPLGVSVAKAKIFHLSLKGRVRFQSARAPERTVAPKSSNSAEKWWRRQPESTWWSVT
eukprot:4045709-Pleurochrysis_carterae.AAC.2